MWDCAKAYLQGHIIAFVSEKKKEREHKQQQLENTIRKLEQQHKRTPTPVLLTELTVALRELNTLISNVMEGRLRFVKQKYYEYGNGACRLFALHLKEQQSTNIVSKLKSKNSSTVLTKPEEIAEKFADFYKSLYKNTDTCTDDQEIKCFLDSMQLPQLRESVRSELDKPITEEEILEIIQRLKNNKTPGPDVFQMNSIRHLRMLYIRIYEDY